MRVAIDARKLHDFGIGTYIRNLLRHVARIDHDTEYVLLCREPDLGVAISRQSDQPGHGSLRIGIGGLVMTGR